MKLRTKSICAVAKVSLPIFWQLRTFKHFSLIDFQALRALYLKLECQIVELCHVSGTHVGFWRWFHVDLLDPVGRIGYLGPADCSNKG